MSRALRLLCFVLVIACGCAAADDRAGSADPTGGSAHSNEDRDGRVVEMNILLRGSYGRLAEDIESSRRRAPFIEVAIDESLYSTLWSRYIGRGEPPSVSFERSLVVFLLLPPQPTGGYGVEPKGVSISGGVIEVDATLHQPGKGDIVTQAFTAPFAVIEVEAMISEVEKVVWINQGRPLATKVLDR